jgi:hypothetical protein
MFALVKVRRPCFSDSYLYTLQDCNTENTFVSIFYQYIINMFWVIIRQMLILRSAL